MKWPEMDMFIEKAVGDRGNARGSTRTFPPLHFDFSDPIAGRDRNHTEGKTRSGLDP
jgi:hypothetical protein